MPKFELSEDLVRALSDSPMTSNPNPAISFLDDFGLADAAVMSRWITEVGTKRFVEIVLAFVKSGDDGRPETDLKRYLDQFDDLRRDNPAWGDYKIASRVAAAAFSKKDWGSYRPPASTKSLAGSIVRHIQKQARTAADHPPNKSDAERERVLRVRAEKRAAALAERAARFIAIADEIKRAAPLLEAIFTSYGSEAAARKRAPGCASPPVRKT